MAPQPQLEDVLLDHNPAIFLLAVGWLASSAAHWYGERATPQQSIETVAGQSVLPAGHPPVVSLLKASPCTSALAAQQQQQQRWSPLEPHVWAPWLVGIAIVVVRRCLMRHREEGRARTEDGVVRLRPGARIQVDGQQLIVPGPPPGPPPAVLNSLNRGGAATT